MKKKILTVILSCFYIAGFAQNGIPQNAGARGAAMGNASLTFTDINSIFTNQAGLGYLEHLSFTAYGERRFLLADGLNSFLFGLAYPHQSIGTIGLSVHYFGYGKYNEQKIGLSYARKLFKRVSIGAQFNYLGTRIGEYGTAHSFTFELGILAKVTKHFHLAAHTFSPVRIELPNGDALPSIFKLGVAYIPSSKLRLTAELEKDLEQPFNGRFGIEYHPINVLYVRAGVSTSPVMASFGLGLNMKGLKIDLATSYHTILGFTPGLSISYVVGDKAPQKASSGH
ncbi:PorV/PorQ family protein [Aureispira anguillae]|uniref:Uncharacterized protein n=1 Tax=Aureispira anguillae TaxID=2864201 RepID=A0A915YBV8_9BACT|nr:hypothetical protein [Aureispira anguillae]BDS10229.1 hypothetical protein AsAng_0009370 [Aureispira anguillae]